MKADEEQEREEMTVAICRVLNDRSAKDILVVLIRLVTIACRRFGLSRQAMVELVDLQADLLAVNEEIRAAARRLGVSWTANAKDKPSA